MRRDIYEIYFTDIPHPKKHLMLGDFLVHCPTGHEIKYLLCAIFVWMGLRVPVYKNIMVAAMRQSYSTSEAETQEATAQTVCITTQQQAEATEQGCFTTCIIAPTPLQKNTLCYSFMLSAFLAMRLITTSARNG